MSRLSRRVPFATALFVAWAVAGCATIEGRDAATLRDEADQLLQQQDLDAAYRKLVVIRERHPDSPEAREVFPAAAAIVKRNWWRNRYRDPSSPWIQKEPAFLFRWFESFVDEDSFPEAEAKRLLVGMPMGFFRSYQEFAATSSVLSMWYLPVEKDNGIVEEVGPARRLEQAGVSPAP